MAEDREVLTTEEAAALFRALTKPVLQLVRSGSLPNEWADRGGGSLGATVRGELKGVATQ